MHCDLCAHVFTLCFSYIMTRASLPLCWAFRGPAPTTFLFTGQHDLCEVTERNSLPTNPSSFKLLLVIIAP